MPYRIALCDDETYFLDTLKELISQYSTEKKIDLLINYFDSGESLVSSNEKFDIAFLDISMKELSGIDVAKILRERDELLSIVFLTSHSEYTRDALSVHAFDYIEKPLIKESFFKHFDSVITYVSKINSHRNLYSESICFETIEGESMLNINDIFYCEYEKRIVRLVTKKGEFIIRTTISKIEERMAKYKFLMPHQSFVVNPNHIFNIRTDTIIMKNNDVIPLALKRSSKFKKNFQGFLKSLL